MKLADEADYGKPSYARNPSSRMLKANEVQRQGLAVELRGDLFFHCGLTMEVTSDLLAATATFYFATEEVEPREI